MRDRRELLHTCVDCGGVLELHCRAGGFALAFYLPAERCSAGIQITLHARDFYLVGVVSAALEAGREAHLHLRVHAAGEGGVGIKVEIAPPHLEKIERAVEEFLCGGTRSKWPVVDGFAAEPADLAGDVGARIFVIEIQADKWRR